MQSEKGGSELKGKRRHKGKKHVREIGGYDERRYPEVHTPGELLARQSCGGKENKKNKKSMNSPPDGTEKTTLRKESL